MLVEQIIKQTVDLQGFRVHTEIFLGGFAPDGGLYLPKAYPRAGIMRHILQPV